MSRRSWWRLVVCSGSILAFASVAGAQSMNGAIIGVVQDSSGAVVPDVAITLRNVATDQTVGTTVSGPDGQYAFRNLQPAKYEVQATKDGFSRGRYTASVSLAQAGRNRVSVTRTFRNR